MKEWELNDKTYCCLISEIKKIRSFDDEEKYIEKYVYPHRSTNLFAISEGIYAPKQYCSG